MFAAASVFCSVLLFSLAVANSLSVSLSAVSLASVAVPVIWGFSSTCATCTLSTFLASSDLASAGLVSIELALMELATGGAALVGALAYLGMNKPARSSPSWFKMAFTVRPSLWSLLMCTCCCFRSIEIPSRAKIGSLTTERSWSLKFSFSTINWPLLLVTCNSPFSARSTWYWVLAVIWPSVSAGLNWSSINRHRGVSFSLAMWTSPAIFNGNSWNCPCELISPAWSSLSCIT